MIENNRQSKRDNINYYHVRFSQQRGYMEIRKKQFIIATPKTEHVAIIIH